MKTDLKKLFFSSVVGISIMSNLSAQIELKDEPIDLRIIKSQAIYSDGSTSMISIDHAFKYHSELDDSYRQIGSFGRQIRPYLELHPESLKYVNRYKGLAIARGVTPQ